MEARCVRVPGQERDGGPVCGFAFLIATVSCGRRDSDSQSPRGGEAAQSVVVYCSADKEFAELVFHAYEAKTGVKVLPLYDTEETKTAGLTARLVAEKARPKADVFWSSDTSRAVALVDQGLTAAYVPKTAAAIPARYKERNCACGPVSARESESCCTTRRR